MKMPRKPFFIWVLGCVMGLCSLTAYVIAEAPMMTRQKTQLISVDGLRDLTQLSKDVVKRAEDMGSLSKDKKLTWGDVHEATSELAGSYMELLRQADEIKMQLSLQKDQEYEVIEDFTLMKKRMKVLQASLDEALSKEDAKAFTEASDQLRFYASKILDTDTKKRRKKHQTYIQYAKAFELQGRYMRELAMLKKPDWEGMLSQMTVLAGQCQQCHRAFKSR